MPQVAPGATPERVFDEMRIQTNDEHIAYI